MVFEQWDESTESAPLLPHILMLLFVSDEAYSPPDTKKVPLTHYFHLYDLEAEDFFDMFKLLLQVNRFCFIS